MKISEYRMILAQIEQEHGDLEVETDGIGGRRTANEPGKP